MDRCAGNAGMVCRVQSFARKKHEGLRRGPLACELWEETQRVAVSPVVAITRMSAGHRAQVTDAVGLVVDG